MKKFLVLGIVLICGVCFGQGTYGGYSQMQPLQGSISDDIQQAQANAYRKREEKREIERIKYERDQQEKGRQEQEVQSQKEYEALDRQAIYKACIASRVGSKLYLFGGKNGEVLLGCLNCDKFDSDSVWNNYGKYGSKFNNESIWNKYGAYGGSYGAFSPFNFGSTPPKIIDDKGIFIGYFTINKYYTDRKENNLLDAICEKWEAISENISEMTK
ncbi:hypothetical protein SAMN05443549_107152 [Flavobacterium fluvii]|uniref:Uncharacterized protein n=1 Tax=Flavobacterium fluvii TaxID=468056 RepID=A0A1M5N8Y9_9FLAO|nr:hypothetical protein [Flavobacterium fluvii]SHG85922.1 hypothetical protein SAMN05443549_107152 [Flavobacterium fluvii]